ncbi:iron-sulfur cluster repair di-iron protein [Niabella ginsenosidivorans]|uniref:Iron-sulfur cluster repair di-iron protein n=2 Tax=Niabella ginsenosidivorans TaxID=1176587 RepID=A0A1A9I2X0_9BACT|nr:iron-sulfur cluster repair di-iron protein [Niabella ginsenosidivorans]
MNISKDDSIGTIAASDLRTGIVFEKFGLDFCCNGNRSIETACKEAQVDLNKVLSALKEIDPQGKPGVDYNTWPLDLLADYIEKKHHRYVSAQIPAIEGLLEKINTVHGQKHPELSEIKKLFSECAGELTMHMKKEELMLFPFIKKMVQASQLHTRQPSAPFGSVQNPIYTMLHEHNTEGERFNTIRLLTSDYTVPPDGCNTYRTAYHALKEFEEDLHLHIHLENNILFPKAIDLEKSFSYL